MAGLSRTQLAVYAAIAVALLLVGARWVRGGDTPAATAGVTRVASDAGGDDGFELERGGGDLVVHIAGEVRDPGVYRLPDGSRVTDAIERAGGPTADALADAINLAAPLADGQQVQVPGRSAGVGGLPGGTGSAAGASGPISLGTATVEQLDTIEGIGPVTAQGILEFRDERCGVASIDELDEISGIGPATMDALRGSLQP
jgi:competence protein ComEA